jgi:Sigma-70 region 2
MDERGRAIERLYGERFVGFRNAVATVSGDYESARDAVQEGFARAFRSRGQFRGEGSLEGWVWRIVLRAAFEQRRGQAELPLDEVGADLVEPERDPVLAEALRELSTATQARRVLALLRRPAVRDDRGGVRDRRGHGRGHARPGARCARAAANRRRGAVMIELHDELLAARFAAIANPLDDSDWLDVVHRARPPRTQRRRLLVLAVAFAGAAIIAVAAYAVARYVIVGSPAPPAVKASERLLNQVKGELIPRAHSGTGIEVAKTKAAAAINASTGPVYLWVAPTRAGGYCAFLQVVGTELPDRRPNLTGGCTSPPLAKLDIDMNAISVHGRMLALVVVHAAGPARTIVIRFRSGAERTLRLGASHFLVAEVKPSDPVRTVSARDAGGRLLAQRQIPAFPAPPKPIGAFRVVAGIRTIGANKPLVLRVAAATRGMRCASFAPAGGAGGICSRPPRPNQIEVNPNQWGAAPHGMLLLWGSVGRLISSLELRFEDGTKIPIRLHHGWASPWHLPPASEAS